MFSLAQFFALGGEESSSGYRLIWSSVLDDALRFYCAATTAWRPSSV